MLIYLLQDNAQDTGVDSVQWKEVTFNQTISLSHMSNSKPKGSIESMRMTFSLPIL
ncbi:hypothetical protein HanXRQr2_Chr17g0783721 [Helianthus annuus]|uniref:Uncharacterized protein n=1 Tax=Helianthus annuus TaxID=4232 RepID=A0A9K3GT12_HELAN|nr:hypothetical protein HanXRQr2_Chr17g0783721 [Helianthus annuus]